MVMNTLVREETPSRGLPPIEGRPDHSVAFYFRTDAEVAAAFKHLMKRWKTTKVGTFIRAIQETERRERHLEEEGR